MEKGSYDNEENYDNGPEGEQQEGGQYKDKFDPNSNEVIVKGLSFKAEGDDVRDFFSKFGEIESVNIERRFNGDSKGSCFIKFLTKEGQENAIAADGVDFMGRQVWINRTRAKQDRVKEFGPRKTYNRGSANGYAPRGNYRGDRREGDRGNRQNYNDQGYDRPSRLYGRGGSGRGGYRDDHDDGEYNNRRDGYAPRGNSYGGRGSGNSYGGRGRGGYRKPREDVEQSKILFVGNLNFRTEKDEIWGFFDTKGKVVDVRIAKNPQGLVSLNLKVDC